MDSAGLDALQAVDWTVDGAVVDVMVGRVWLFVTDGGLCEDDNLGGLVDSVNTAAIKTSDGIFELQGGGRHKDSRLVQWMAGWWTLHCRQAGVVDDG